MNDERIERAKWLLQHVRHAAMATVNSDGTPHNTPYFFVASDDLKELYWGGHPGSLHSQNLMRDGNVFVVLYEADKGGGLYVRCQHAREATDNELDRALAALNKRRALFGKEPLRKDYYESTSPQRLYIADSATFWVNYAERNQEGLITEDKRHEVERQQLLNDSPKH